jgi:hypothetical protein
VYSTNKFHVIAVSESMKSYNKRKFQERVVIFTQTFRPALSLSVIYGSKSSCTKMASKYVIFK